MLFVDALGAGGEYRTRNREIVSSTAGVPVAELSIVPPLYVSRTISAQRKVRPLPTAQREAALAKTADAFATGVIAGLDFDAYVGLVSRISGLPIAVTRAGARGVATPLPRRSMPCGPPGPPAPPSIGARSAPATEVRYGRGVGRCSRCTPLETARAFTACGRRRSHWVTGWRFVRRAASP